MVVITGLRIDFTEVTTVFPPGDATADDITATAVVAVELSLEILENSKG